MGEGKDSGVARPFSSFVERRPYGREKRKRRYKCASDVSVRSPSRSSFFALEMTLCSPINRSAFDRRSGRGRVALSRNEGSDSPSIE